jgi:hypothetical protein
MSTVRLEDLVGRHELSGVELDYRRNNANSIKFVLDGVVYTAMEDEDDGYRSCLGEILIEGEVKNTFDPVVVDCKMSTGGSERVLEMTNPDIGKAIVRIGTDETDSYYPTYVAEFNPVYLTEAAYAKLLLAVGDKSD